MNDMSSDESDHPILDPALSEEAFSCIEVRKAHQSISKLESTSSKSQRGTNWNDDDSILLVQAVAYVQEHPISISYQHTFLIVVGESKVVMHQRMATYFNSTLRPSTSRTSRSFTSRWSDMQSTYKFLPS